ncbi:hypothetical protein BDY17DRAFT_303090 [Neohortaea acidophila]|uniref:GRIP domain-containing protein n=1 Tax=Neohortaea acidophila TaxID=245834 RepID=A0A6A6PJZ3_9PEZI|nr:uncharacterized protein BDY17DRAFT_303090 [Neohortaea acidophila]KAF2480021.1 hypothetical protein BDY17DRAFT_303090 [Neohortaea acidophila]
MPSSPPESARNDNEAPARNGPPPEAAAPAAVDSSTPQPDAAADIPEHDRLTSTSTESSDAASRLDALQLERDNLRAEVTQLRQSLESLQERHTQEVSGLKDELETSNQSKESALTQHRNLLGKVNQIRSQLGERLKQDAEELEQARARIEELEKSNGEAGEEEEKLREEVSRLSTQVESQSSEIEGLRSRTSVSTSNWARERDDLVAQEAYVREEYEMAKQAMQDWEILATEERSRREALEERAQELEEQLSTQKEAYERVRNETEMQSGTVDGLQRALREVQEQRKTELRELVEQSDAQLEDLRKQSKASEDAATALRQQLADTQQDLERALPFEKEVKEKNLLIGKLRHEGVILNEHLIKALRFLKRGKPEDNVDRQLVTNHFLQFLALDRSDPKKFQILQLIAALLGWTEEQREQAGLLRQGSNIDSLKIPMSPFRRTPSTPALTTDFMVESPSGTGRESLAELWSEFLEREAEAGTSSSSRSSSVVKGSTGRTPSLSAVTSPVRGPGGREVPEIKRQGSQGTTGGG